MSELLLVLKVLAACAGGVLLLFAFVYAIGIALRRAEPYLEHRRQEALRYPPEGNFLWPRFPSADSARVYCLGASFIPFLFALLYAVAGWFRLFGYGPWVWLFCCAFVAAGLAMRRGSRAGPALALGSYAVLVAFQLSQGSLPNLTLLLFGADALVNGFRAATLLHRGRPSTAAA
jgi:hypothetical protein